MAIFKKIFVVLATVVPFAAIAFAASACNETISSTAWKTSWKDWYSCDRCGDFENYFFDGSWVYRDDDKAVRDYEEEKNSGCDDECGCDAEPVITAPTYERKGNFYAYRQGSCANCRIDFKRWSSTDDMEDFIPEGATIRVEGGIDVYIVKYKHGKMFKRLVLNPEVFDNYEHLRWEDVMNVSRDVLEAYTTSDLVRSVETGKVYRLYPNDDRGTKHLVVENGCFWKRIDWDSVYVINGFDERSYTTSSSLK
jgi:hypothetical protein